MSSTAAVAGVRMSWAPSVSMTHHMQQHSGRKQLAPWPSSSSELCHMQHMHIAQQCLLDTVFDRLSDLSCHLR